jgi:hypothetical protein
LAVYDNPYFIYLVCITFSIILYRFWLLMQTEPIIIHLKDLTLQYTTGYSMKSSLTALNRQEPIEYLL